jgi:phosphatidylserine/phosphatidylglycerophosphate/cardiolipin synthase-like enzyme
MTLPARSADFVLSEVWGFFARNLRTPGLNQPYYEELMPNPWEPVYWFLADDETVKVKLRETNKDEWILKNELFQGRVNKVDGWEYQNSNPNNPDAWGMSDADKELTKAYTSNNQVTALIDGKDFMSDLHTQISKLTKGDFVLIAGWEFWQYRSLDKRVYFLDPAYIGPGSKQGTREDDPTLLPAVLKTVDNNGNGADVRVLAFGKGPPGCKQRTENFVEEVNKIRKNSAFLAAPRNFAMSHHQKEVLLARSRFEESRAYVGGMDLAIHRFDDSDHKAPDAENGPKTMREGNFGWHDIQVVVQGDAMVQLWANFAERWDDARKERKVPPAPPTGIDRRTLPSVSSAEDLLPCPVPEWAKKGKGWQSRSKNIGNKYVQVLRTVGPASAKEQGRERFMKKGERTVMCALKKAIEKAECYIYIEEQFLWDCELADFIAREMEKPEKKDLHLIIVMTAGCELPFEFKNYGFFLRDAFFRTVLKQDRMTGNIVFGKTTRVYPYGLFQKRTDGHKEIYVHSKLIIIDDRYVAVGSANVDARSLHIETELTLGIVDGDTVTSTLGGNRATVCKFAKELREKLWKEHLGVDLSQDPDPIEALKKFPGVDGSGWPQNKKEAIQQEKHHVRCYINVPGANLAIPSMRRLIDRNNRVWSG